MTTKTAKTPRAAHPFDTSGIIPNRILAQNNVRTALKALAALDSEAMHDVAACALRHYHRDGIRQRGATLAIELRAATPEPTAA